MTRKITSAVILTTVALLVVFNIVMLVEPTPDDAISNVVHDWSRHHAIVPYALGVLCGHWFLPWRRMDRLLGYVLLIAMSMAVLAFDAFAGIGMSPIIALAVGLLTGGVTWGMNEGA